MKYFLLSPELGDGSAETVLPCSRPNLLIDSIEAWLEYSGVNDSFSVKIVEMSPEEVAELPYV